MYKEIIKGCGCLWVGLWVNVDACKMSRSFSWLMAQKSLPWIGWDWGRVMGEWGGWQFLLTVQDRMKLVITGE